MSSRCCGNRRPRRGFRTVIDMRRKLRLHSGQRYFHCSAGCPRSAFRIPVGVRCNHARKRHWHRRRVASAVLLISALAANLDLPLCAQQPVDSSGASGKAALPVDIQARLDKSQEALKAAHATGDLKAEAKALNQVSRVYFDTSDFKKALDGYNEALAMARNAKDALDEAAALIGIGNCNLSVAENAAAMEAYRQALSVASASGDMQGQAVALGGLGWGSNMMGRNQEALDFYHRALPLAQKASDRDIEARVLRRTGWVYYILGDMPKALEYDQQALPVFRKIRNPYGKLRCSTISVWFTPR